MAASTAFTRRVWKHFLDNKGHDAFTMPALNIRSAHPTGVVKASLQIEQRNVNRLSSLHGGLISTLVDTGGSLSLSARGFWLTGVSTDIHVTFLRGAGGPGQTIDIEAKVDSIGKTLAFTSVIISNPDNGKVLARGSHTKYIKPVLDNPKNVKFDETGDRIVEGQMPE